ncbi:MAG: 50S ribosomal protein L32e [Thermoplasmata archaeon]|nr:50S ribosomal protein L32e [Candidatus Sysuiplasma acidicola]MBX8646631.1 50S ribosomal protein L32e [Candidatus Sysuiplasma acidicola]
MKLNEVVGDDAEVMEKLSAAGITDVDALDASLKNDEKRSELEKSGIAAETLDAWKAKIEAGEEEQKDEPAEETEDVQGYTAKQKPVLTPELRKALVFRKELEKHRPEFLRAECYKAERLGHKWRRPRGGQGKMRVGVYYRPKSVSIGYGSPSTARHLHPSGFAEKLVHNAAELDGVDPKTTAVRVAHAVGTKKRKEIAEEAARLNIRVLNG